jgi:hypothetical protein
MNIPLPLHLLLHPVSWPALNWLRARWQARLAVAPADAGLEALVDLDVRTLDDIGAPERLLSRAHAHREAQRRCRDDLHAGLASVGWRDW